MQRFLRLSFSNQCRSIGLDSVALIRPIAIGRNSSTCNNSASLLVQPARRSMKIYTRTGDKGESSLFTGERRPKTSHAFHALGTVDELSCTIAIALAHIEQAMDKQTSSLPLSNSRQLLLACEQLELIQGRLQALGSAVATPLPQPSPESDGKRSARYERVTFPDSVVQSELELWIDGMTEQLPPLRQFILPSGGLPGSALHYARAVCRRAERCVLALNSEVAYPTVEPAVLRYLNRLSDYLFTVARFVSHQLEKPEKLYIVPKMPQSIRMYPGDELGRGAGKGGGTGGSIRDAGGAFGKRQAAQEEEYFHRKEKEQLATLKKHLEEEMDYRREEIEKHKEAIKRHEKLIKELAKDK